MKRHPALQPLSRDHNAGLIEARRLRQAADDDPAVLLEAARSFARFFAADAIDHFREEEELAFPLLLRDGEGAPGPLVDALLEHQRLYALVRRLEAGIERDAVDPELARELGALLDAHIRLEERVLFPLIEQAAGEELEALELADEAARPDPPGGPVVDLRRGALRGEGPLWGTASDDLNATLLAWPPGGGTPEHVNEERDVLVVCLAGEGTVRIDGEEHPLGPARAVIVPKGSSRRIAAGRRGIRYLTAHLRRPGLQLGRFGG
jgi:quercetin dioxygenase-like cupin family protein